MLKNSKRIFISNRLPFHVNPMSGLAERGSGGLVSALLGIDLDEPFWWLGFETNKKNAEQLVKSTTSIQKNLRLKPIFIESDLYDKYYDGFCNDVIWPLFHYESQYTFYRQDSWNAYKQANQLMADEILKIAEPNDTIWIHDFHFLLLPQMLKDKKPNLKVGLFLHIPFPSSEIFRQLPVRYDILTAMSHADLLGFHDHSYLRHFTVALSAHLGTESSVFKARIGGHTLHLGVYPISIDTQKMTAKAKSLEVVEQCAKYRESIHSDFLVLGVDRLDHSKGLELKLGGFRRMLQKYPETRGHVNLLQVAVPSRLKVPSYARLKKQIDQLVGKINGEYSQPGYVPVQYIFNSLEETNLLALYRRAESILVTSKRDGMNLVAMEYAICQDLETPGTVIVSEFAGVASLLSRALIINPWDPDSIADALYAAFKMSKATKRDRLEELQSVLLKYSATEWARTFLEDLDLTQPNIRAATRTLGANHEKWPKDLDPFLSGKEHRSLVLDYDGTLVAHRMVPELAIIDEDMKDLLWRLNDYFDLYVISGRDRNFLEKQFADMPCNLVAEHGAFYRENKKWMSQITTDTSTWKSEVSRVMSSYCKRVPGTFIEEKEASIVWHYRQAPINFAEFQAKKLQDELQVCLANSPVTIAPGSKIIEAKATECNKGNYLRQLFEKKPADQFLVLGDDYTDEDMFRVLDDRGVSVKVGWGATYAHLRLNEQLNVFPFLKELFKSVSSNSDRNTK